MRDTDAAKDLMYRRAKCLSEFENANKALDKARAKNKDISAVSMIQFALLAGKGVVMYEPISCLSIQGVIHGTLFACEDSPAFLTIFTFQYLILEYFFKLYISISTVNSINV